RPRPDVARRARSVVAGGPLLHSPSVSPDDITEAVLACDDVAKYLGNESGGADLDARRRVESYLDELRTKQRYRFYRALQHPLYPILRKIERRSEHVEIVEDATRAGRVIY